MLAKKKIGRNLFTFVICGAVGLLNTVFLKEEHVDTWRNYVGYILLIGALFYLVEVVKALIKGTNSR